MCTEMSLCVCIICEHISISCFQQFMHGCFHICKKIAHTSAYTGMISAKLTSCVIRLSCRHFFHDHISKKIASFDLIRYITDQWCLKWSFGNHLIQPFCSEQSLPDHVQSGFEPFHSLAGQTVPVSDDIQRKKVFSYVYTEFPVF